MIVAVIFIFTMGVFRLDFGMLFVAMLARLGQFDCRGGAENAECDIGNNPRDNSNYDQA